MLKSKHFPRRHYRKRRGFFWTQCRDLLCFLQETGVFVIQLLNAYPDQFDIKHVLNPQTRLNMNRMSTQQIKEYLILNGHCSALVKVNLWNSWLHWPIGNFLLMKISLCY